MSNDTGAALGTVETVAAEDYTVRVAQTADGAAWQAVVVETDTGSDGPSLGGHPLLMMQAATNDDADADDAVPCGPTVTAPHRWVAIGFAIEAYEFGEIDEEPVSVPEGYDLAAIRAEMTPGDLLDELDGPISAEDIVGDLPDDMGGGDGE